MNHYLIGSAVMPSILLVWFFHRRDLYPEPARVLWATFFLGVLTVIPVLLVVHPYSEYLDMIENPILSGAVTAFAGAAIPEEFFKYLVVVLYCSRHKEFDEPMDGIVYGVIASLGFATLENILYVADGGYGVALMRAITAVPGHALTGAIMGYFIGQAKFGDGNSKRQWALAFLIPTLLHGLYDFPLMAVSSYANAHGGDPGLVILLLGLVLAVIIYEWFFVVRRMRRLRAEQETRAPVATYPNAIVLDEGQTSLPMAKAIKQTTTTKDKVLGVFYLLLGTVLASAGGVMCLGMVVSLRGGKETETGVLLAVIGLFIVLPLLLGIWLFRKGVARMNNK